MQIATKPVVTFLLAGAMLVLWSPGVVLGSWPPAITDPEPLNGNAGTDNGWDWWDPRVATDGQGHWVAVWGSDDSTGGYGPDYDILTARSSDYGASWTFPTALNSGAATDLEDDGDPHVATDGAGNWIAVWGSDNDLNGTIGTDTDILFARSIDNGATWTAAAPLNSTAPTDSGHDGIPFIATDGQGVWVVAWASREDLGGTVGTDLDIFVARSIDNGLTWTPTTPLSINAAVADGDDQRVQLATDTQGHWVAVWHSHNDLGGTIDTDEDILVSRSADDGATWTDPAALNSNAAEPSPYCPDSYPSLATDGQGTWVTVWESGGVDRDIRFSISTDNGLNWSAWAPLNPDEDDFLDFLPSVATDTAGNWVVVYDSYDNLNGTIGDDDDVLVVHSTNGGATWTAPIPLNTNAYTDSAWDTGQTVAADKQGHFIVPWQSDNSLGGTIGTDWDLLYARFDLPPVGDAVPPAAEPGGPDCSEPIDCVGAWAGASCVGVVGAKGVCYVSKNRYLSIDPTVNEGAVAYRVEITVTPDYPTAIGRTWWVDEPVCYDYPNGDPVLPAPPTCDGADRFGWVSGLTLAPVTRVWSEVSLHVADCGIVPNTVYEIRASGDGGGSFSEPLIINTAADPDGPSQSWGDITGGPVPDMPGLWLPPEGSTNMADVGNAIRTFENQTEDTGCPPRVWVDVEINQVINLGDVQFLVSAFEGAAYADLADLEFIGVHPADCPSVPPGMAVIPGGEFEMGDHHGAGWPNELPVHAVYVDPFYMEIYEVTNQQYAEALNWALGEGLVDNPSSHGGVVYRSGGTTVYCDTTASSSYSRITWDGATFGVTAGKEDHPMLQVSWYGAAAYANWQSVREGRDPSYSVSTWACDFEANGYRLPTEAEWEYAARGGEHSPYYLYPWGDTIDGSNANYPYSGDPYEGSDPETTPVGYYDGGQTPPGVDMANGYGLYDVAGNVWELCNDWYDDDYYASSPYDNPRGPATGEFRVVRGGSWGDMTHYSLRCATREFIYPDEPFLITGFRLVLDAH